MVFVPHSAQKSSFEVFGLTERLKCTFPEHMAETTFCWPGWMSLQQEFRFEIGKFEPFTP